MTRKCPKCGKPMQCPQKANPETGQEALWGCLACMYAEFDEDPLLRHNRVETASTLGNAIIDVINEHVMAHGVHDPALTNILLAAIATVVIEINSKVDGRFGRTLAEMLDKDVGD